MKMRASASSTCTQHSTINAQACYGALSGCVPSGTVHDHLLSCRLQLVQLAAAMLNQMQCTHLHLGYPVGQHVRACSCARCGGQGPPAASAGLKVRAKPAAWAQGRHCVGTRTVDSRQTAFSKEATVSPTRRRAHPGIKSSSLDGSRLIPSVHGAASSSSAHIQVSARAMAGRGPSKALPVLPGKQWWLAIGREHNRCSKKPGAASANRPHLPANDADTNLHTCFGSGAPVGSPRRECRRWFMLQKLLIAGCLTIMQL